ncbi:MULTISPECIES: RNA polymerase sigma factor [unclassified Aureispira]|uniref:RNA polymerase sigma factor n=1 Tax=unclassified Aureispira TaxID=2649989 RepID=UPI000696B112|nr:MULTISPECIES: sigma-70 family RNA polymerase sigma factor [unclassified Aureispira]WMX16381.1 sigma-70 family RNA polymerase sigma factor [Aureispira sp. CCB-E]
MAIALNISTTEHTAKDVQSSSNEAKLIAGCLAEERWAQKQLYEQHYGKMMGICLRYSNNSEDAKDILNEGFIKVFRYLQRYKIGTSLEGWIRRIMINTSIDFYRKAIRHRTEDIEYASNTTATGEDAISKYSAKEILSVIQTLPPSYRAVFNLYAIEGYSHREVANQLGISESTSRSNLVKARAKLKVLLTELYK